MKNKIILVVRVITAAILLQTLYFKFSAHPDSVYIFSTVGMEPYGRIGIGVLELIASILLFIPRYVWAGAGLALGVIAGAVFLHLTQLGIEVNGDGGGLFYTAVAILFMSAIILWHYRKDIPLINL